MTIDITNPAYLKWSVQRALLGNVSANLAGLHASLDLRHINVSAYFFEEPTALDKELVEVIAAEVIADFSNDYVFAIECRLISAVALNRVEWNFLRSEAYAFHRE